MNTQQLKNVLAMDKYCKNIIFDVCALDQLSDKKNQSVIYPQLFL